MTPKNNFVVIALTMTIVISVAISCKMFGGGTDSSNGNITSGANKTAPASETQKKPTRGIPAATACSLFEKAGLKGEYTKSKTSEMSYSCSATKDLGYESGVLEYYAAGESETMVDYLKISITQLLARKKYDKEKKVLVAGAGDLANLVTGQPLSNEIINAIMTETSGKWQVADTTIKFEKRESTSVSHDLQVYFQLY